MSEIQIHESHPPKLLFAIANPIMKLLLKSPLHGLLDDHLILLRWRGHKSGQEYTIPVGYKREDDTLTIFTFSGWKANFREPHPVEVQLHGEWHSGTGVIDPDPEHAARYIKESVKDDDPGAYRRFRMQIEGDRQPTIEELIPEVKKRGMVLIRISLNR